MEWPISGVRISAVKGCHLLLLLLPAFIFGGYPLAVIVSANAGMFSVDMFVLARSLFAVIAAITSGVWLLRRVQPDFAARAMWVNWVALIVAFYDAAVWQAKLWGFRITADAPFFAAGYALSAVAIGTIVSRPWKTYPRNPVPLNLFAAALLGATMYPIGAAAFAADAADWRERADAMIRSSLTSRIPGEITPSRNIYYVILDGMGRSDVVDEMYGTRLSSFVSALEHRGFFIAREAQSNYSQTYLSLASTLNMNYLDDVAASMRSSRDRRPLDYLIQNNALMQAARGAGYHLAGISSDYLVTERWDAVDTCECARYGLDEMEQYAIAKTPLAALRLDRWTFDAHRRKVIQAFEAIEQSASSEGPLFVVAHIIAPHPPFVFGADGSASVPRAGTKFDFGDGDHFVGSKRDYVDGYRNQIEFVTSRLTALIEALLSRPGPAPVIIIHGDHGPGSRLGWNIPHGTDMRERMGIFAAYYFPDPGVDLYPTLSPVNGTRLLSSRYMGLQLPLLADKSFFSTWNEPYSFIPVDVK